MNVCRQFVDSVIKMKSFVWQSLEIFLFKLKFYPVKLHSSPLNLKYVKLTLFPPVTRATTG